MSSSAVKFSIAYFVIQTVLGYENAYDLLEARNSRYYQPRNFQSSFHDSTDRFVSQNRNPYARVNPHFSRFGNGYDNLGNGISDFRRFSWRPIQERHFDFVYPGVRIQPDYSRRHSGLYYRTPLFSFPFENEFSSRDDLNFGKVDHIHEDNEDKNERKSDELYQRNQEKFKMDFARKEKAGEQLLSDQVGENKSSSRSNKVLKKSRTTKGFAVHHHKDETGNSTTYIDEVSDFGGHSDLRDISDEFGLRKTLEQTTHIGDEKYLTKSEDQTNKYDSGFLLGNQKFEKDYSSTGGHQQSRREYNAGNENGDIRPRKTYQYLNGDKFEYTEPHTDDFY